MSLTIIGLTGKAGAGKNSVADRLCEEFGFVQAALAEPIRDMATVLLQAASVDHAWLFERHLKEQEIPGLGVSGRRLMQTLGTEWGRAVHPDIWIRIAARSLGLPAPGASQLDLVPVNGRIVITDVRFPNEAAWIRQMGGKVVRVHRHVESVAAHESEAHAEQMLVDHVVNNTGTLADLNQAVEVLMTNTLAEAA